MNLLWRREKQLEHLVTLDCSHPIKGWLTREHTCALSSHYPLPDIQLSSECGTVFILFQCTVTKYSPSTSKRLWIFTEGPRWSANTYTGSEELRPRPLSCAAFGSLEILRLVHLNQGKCSAGCQLLSPSSFWVSEVIESGLALSCNINCISYFFLWIS